MLNRFLVPALSLLGCFASVVPARAQPTQDDILKAIQTDLAAVKADVALTAKTTGAKTTTPQPSAEQKLAALYPCPPGRACCYRPYPCLAVGETEKTYALVRAALGLPNAALASGGSGDGDNKLVSLTLKNKSAADVLADKQFADYVKPTGAVFIIKTGDKTLDLAGRAAAVDALKLAISLYDAPAPPPKVVPPLPGGAGKPLLVTLKNVSADDLLKDKQFSGYVDYSKASGVWIFKTDAKVVAVLGVPEAMTPLGQLIALYDGTKQKK